MTFETFAITVALEDDTGRRYDRVQVTADLRRVADVNKVQLFTIAHGRGIDTETDSEEPVVVLQGGGDPDAVAQFGRIAASYAGWALNQRAIGWFTSTDSYRPTPEEGSRT